MPPNTMEARVTTTLLTNIAELTTHADPGTLADAALVVADGRVA